MDFVSQKEDTHPERLMRNFVSWYRHLLPLYQANMLTLSSELRETIPGLDSFKLVSFSEEARGLSVYFQAHNGNEGARREYAFDSLSEGQRVLIVLYTLLFGLKGQGHMLFLDEPDNYVSLDEIQPWLMACQDLCGEGIPQIVLISHHPEAIDYLGGAYGLWIDRGSNDAAQSARPIPPDDSGLKLSETIARGWVE